MRVGGGKVQILKKIEKDGKSDGGRDTDELKTECGNRDGRKCGRAQ